MSNMKHFKLVVVVLRMHFAHMTLDTHAEAAQLGCKRIVEWFRWCFLQGSNGAFCKVQRVLFAVMWPDAL
jgi:hypothetical protein